MTNHYKTTRPSFVKMVAFWAEMGVAYLEINILPCLHEIDIPKCINVQFRVYSIYKTKLGVIGFFVLSFLPQRKNVEVLSSLRCQRLGRLSFRLSFFVKSPFLKNYQRYPFETWNTCSLSKEEPITTRQMTPVICMSRIICPCFDIVHVHRNQGYFLSIIKISQ